ncbi:MAG TPA: 3-oxoacyl-ACP reductase FabG [Steroidobacteraceae bacterium]|jgi:3-oxoacyl-[acyl-carrier protein] reductase|nr:3-oxoacyl-ACP reductase FabG [Steroidobacteraceae bacterium]
MSTHPRRALVTGGAGAIGSAICRRLARAGLFVYVQVREAREDAHAFVRELQSLGAGAELLAFDLTDAAACEQVLSRVLAAGPVQVLVNNAAIHDDAAFPAMQLQQWQRVLDVSLLGFFHVTRTLVLPMIRTRWGRIISLSSVAALKGNRGQVNYAAAKGAINAATRALALEVATRGITVNAVAPGIIATPMSASSFDAAAIERLVPMQRAGGSEEVAELVGFLASEAAGYITGQVLSINGGMYT